MSRSVYLSPRADRDLIEIGNYISPDNDTAAERLIAEFFRAFDLLAGEPGLGRARDDLSPGLHVFTVGRYQVMYRINRSELRIVRVVHGSRHLPALFPARRRGGSKLQ